MNPEGASAAETRFQAWESFSKRVKSRVRAVWLHNAELRLFPLSGPHCGISLVALVHYRSHGCSSAPSRFGVGFYSTFVVADKVEVRQTVRQPTVTSFAEAAACSRFTPRRLTRRRAHRATCGLQTVQCSNAPGRPSPLFLVLCLELQGSGSFTVTEVDDVPRGTRIELLPRLLSGDAHQFPTFSSACVAKRSAQELHQANPQG